MLKNDSELNQDYDVVDVSDVENKENRLIIDYFTFVSKIDNRHTLIKLLGLENLNFIETKGWYGYTKQLYYEGIHILYAGSVDMGVCVEMSGKGCRNFEKYGSGDYYEIFSYIQSNNPDVRVTRLDVAYDDFTGLLDFNRLIDDIEQENYLSRFREFKLERVLSKDIKKRSLTLYCGSHSSEIMFRIYDKRAEQKMYDQLDHWVRFEIQLRRDRADCFINLLLSGNDLSALYCGVIKNYLRIVVRSESDSNLSRAQTAAYWSEFLGTVEAVSLFQSDDDYDETRLERFVKVQCSSALVSYIALFGFNNFCHFILGRSSVKINDKHNTLLFNNGIDDIRTTIRDSIIDFRVGIFE